MERRLIEEMAEMRGGRGRLEKIRDECALERMRLHQTINKIDEILDAEIPGDEETVDAPTE